MGVSPLSLFPQVAQPIVPLALVPLKSPRGEGRGLLALRVTGPHPPEDLLRRRLKRELARVTEERDILKKATAYFARESQ